MLIDACHSGGFWQTEFDPFESEDPYSIPDVGDLNRLSNIAFFASALESGTSKFGYDGLPIISKAVTNYFQSSPSDPYDPEKIFDYVGKYLNEKDFYNNVIVYEMGFGDVVQVDRSSFQPQVFTSADFRGGAEVPEPGTWVLMMAGFALAGGVLRRRRSLLA